MNVYCKDRLIILAVTLLIAAIPLIASQSLAQDFSIIVLPDTQFYSQDNPQDFQNMTQWIVANRSALNIAYVVHVGDVVNIADQQYQWDNADAAMGILEDPVGTSLTDGIPYGICPGNHDQSPFGDPDGTQNYNLYFGESRFSTRGYYGGYYGSDNDNQFSLFSAG